MADLVDTNVLSEPRKPRPDLNVQNYFRRRERGELYISTLNLAELRFGIIKEGSLIKRATLEQWLADVIVPFFAGRTLELTQGIILRWRILIEQGRKSGRTYSQPDLFLAATALEHDLILVTRNTRDFAGIPGIQLLNPWEPTPPDQTP